jgi:hypothetical protein
VDTLQVLWEGCDGSTWDLLDPFSPVRATELSGLGLPGFTQSFAEAAAVDGRRYEGTTWGANIVGMKVVVGDDYVPDGYTARRTGDDWRALDRAWRASLSPEVTGRLVVISGAGRRQLELRLDSPAAPAADRDPGTLGVARYDYTLTADDHPWWTGRQESEEFTYNDQSQPFFGGSTGSVLLFISPASAMSDAAIANPGDRPAPPLWWARGPFASLKVGVDDKLIPLPFPLASGQELHVDAEAQTVVDGQGGNLWPLLGYTNPVFAEIPPGERVPVRIELTGAAAGAVVGVSIVPRYHGPW